MPESHRITGPVPTPRANDGPTSSQETTSSEQNTSPQQTTRRDFLKLGAYGVAGAAALSTLPVRRLTQTRAYRPLGSTTTTLTLAYDGSQSAGEATIASMKGFLKANPGVQLKLIAINATDHNVFLAKVLALIAAGSPPDVMSLSTEGLQLTAQKNLAVPLNDLVLSDRSELAGYFADVNPVLIEASMYDGVLYQLPTAFNAANMFYDVPAFEKVGIGRPASDWTQDDFEQYAKKFAGKGNLVAWDWIVRLWGSWTTWMYANDANLLAEGKSGGGDWLWKAFYPKEPPRSGGWKWGMPTANSPGTIEALQYMIELQKAGLSPAPDVGGGTTLQGLFASNHIAMTIGGGFWAGGLHAAGMSPNQFDVQYFPKWKVQKPLFGAGGYVVLPSSKQQALGWELMKYLVSPEGIAPLNAGNVTTPSRRSMMYSKEYSPTGPRHWEVFYNTLDQFPNATPIPAPPYYVALANSLNVRTTQAMSTGNAKTALDDMQRDLEALAS